MRKLGVGLALAGALCALQRPFREYTSIEGYDVVPLPPDWQDRSEWVFARLMYPPGEGGKICRSAGGVARLIGKDAGMATIANKLFAAMEARAATIPEPSTSALLVTGLIGTLAYAWRKRK